MMTSDSNVLIMQDDGIFVEFDEIGVPLGMWHQDEEGVWIFDEFPPLGALDFTLPQTGGGLPPSITLGIIGTLLVTAGILLRRKKRVK